MVSGRMGQCTLLSYIRKVYISRFLLFLELSPAFLLSAAFYLFLFNTVETLLVCVTLTSYIFK